MCAERAASSPSIPPLAGRAVLVVLVVVMVVMVLLPLCLLSQPGTPTCALLLPRFSPPLVLAEGHPAGTRLVQEQMGGEGWVSWSGASVSGARQSGEGWNRTHCSGSPLHKTPRGSSC